MHHDAKQLIDETLELASLPAVVMRAMELLNNPHTSASDIGAVVSQDPALSARLLKIVNSSFYGFPSRIDTISRAITIVGTLELTDLILGSSAISVFDRLPNELINMQKFWEHSLYAGVVARILARQLRAPNTERCFVMGLLHDIGSLVLYHQQPDKSRQALELANRADAVQRIIAKARKLGRVQARDTQSAVNEALAARAINVREAEVLRQFERLHDQVIQVDAFHDYGKNNSRGVRTHSTADAA